MFNKNVLTKEIVDAVLDDLFKFTVSEMNLYLQEQKSTDLSNCVITNLALFELGAADTEKGIAQLRNLLNADRFDQFTVKRLRQLLHYLYMRHGQTVIDQLHARSIATFFKVYPEVDPQTINQLDRELNTFWLLPLLKEAYQRVMVRPENK